MVFPFPDALAGFFGSILAVWTGEAVLLDRRAPAWGLLRGWRRVITKVESKVRSLDFAGLARARGNL